MGLLAGMVRFFAPEVEIVEIPAWDCLPYDRISPNAGIMAERLRALAAWLAAVPAGARGWCSPPPTPWCRRCRRPSRGARGASARRGRRPGRSRRAASAYLERNGYHRTSAVVEAGDYAVRGGLVDIFPSGLEQPVRLDFFGSTLEFDPQPSIPLTQRSLAKLDRLDLMPVSEVLLDAAAIERFQAGYLRQFGAVTGDPLLEAVATGRAFPGMEHWLPLFHRDLVPITAYLDAGGARSASTIWPARPSRPAPR